MTPERLRERFLLLSPRERQVFLAIGQGYLISELAKRTFRSHKTISTHAKRACDKMGARHTEHLRVFAARFLEHNPGVLNEPLQS